jgi:hypothetical protein
MCDPEYCRRESSTLFAQWLPRGAVLAMRGSWQCIQRFAELFSKSLRKFTVASACSEAARRMCKAEARARTKVDAAISGVALVCVAPVLANLK